ncbi:unnamed protein product [Symbiodinium sp. CCMP2456]|nr:unnamed protein product [Symbiodinium sp. CCMP2456]
MTTRTSTEASNWEADGQNTDRATTPPTTENTTDTKKSCRGCTSPAKTLELVDVIVATLAPVTVFVLSIRGREGLGHSRLAPFPGSRSQVAQGRTPGPKNSKPNPRSQNAEGPKPAKPSMCPY